MWPKVLHPFVFLLNITVNLFWIVTSWPGTVLSKEKSAGAALMHLQNVSRFGRIVMASFKPILLPVIYVDVFTNTLLQTIINDSSTKPWNLVDEIVTVQSILDLKTGCISIKWIQILLPFVPINVRDRLQTLIDLNQSEFSKQPSWLDLYSN